MANGPPIPLTAVPISLDSPEYAAICGWPFTDPYVARLLSQDVPQRKVFGYCSIWTYREPGGSLVGFGTLDRSKDCAVYVNGNLHPYIPLLAVNPTIKSKGYGTSIVSHLIGEAALLASRRMCCDVLFLDVYTTNLKAITLYKSLGFGEISPAPIPDPDEDGKPFVIMGRRVSISKGGGNPSSSTSP